ncbi:MAG TPA: glycosyltransferase family 2 protein [Pyrinomonadaceae bacterium]|jgi:glycosyltransferase involved in cell wall biosynthesis|nr:glycosyltransferase family 2 protein [Pyrinomonadaceae bacterium]
MSNILSRPGISVFFPAYNDAQSIEKLVENALAVLPGLTDDYEVIVINDGSTDNTQDVLDQLQAKHPEVRIVEHETNKGYGAALRSGFNAASKDLVFYTDGDGQYDVRELLKLFPLLTENVDVVNGYKLERTDKVNRKIIGSSYNHLAHFLFSLPIRDVDCDFRLIRRAILGKIALHSTSGSICVELVYKLRKAGANFKEVGVNHYARQFGQSQFFTVRRVSKTLLDFFLLWLKLIVVRKN